jgi:hypothetical protein
MTVLADHPATATRSPFLMAGVWTMVIGVVYLPRFVIPMAGGSGGGDEQTGIPICLVTAYLGIALILASGAGYLDRRRLMAWCLMIAAAMLSTLTSIYFSVMSLWFLLVMYIPFLFVVPLDEGDYRACIGVWQICMLPVVAVAVLQFVTQDTYDPLKEYFGNFLIGGFNTRPILEYGSTFRKSDGLFLLEPSSLSQFCSIALTLELMYFKNRWRVATYAVGLVTSVSLSGVVMLSVFLAWYAWTHKKMWHAALIIAAVIAGGVLFKDNEIVASVLNRQGELSDTDSSAYNRFVAPLVETAYLIPDLPTLLSGVGPGNSSSNVLLVHGIDSEKVGGMWPPLKLLAEYGIITAFIGCLFMWRLLFSGARSHITSSVMTIFYVLMGGGLLLPEIAYVVLVVHSLFPRAED